MSTVGKFPLSESIFVSTVRVSAFRKALKAMRRTRGRVEDKVSSQLLIQAELRRWMGEGCF